tara:strand:+ start:1949 stop:6166 length:4218 start_codon:yes stop_codon:yes gene_type:complete
MSESYTTEQLEASFGSPLSPQEPIGMTTEELDSKYGNEISSPKTWTTEELDNEFGPTTLEKVGKKVGRVAAQVPLEAGALLNMFLGFPSFVGKAGSQIGGTAGIYQRGQRQEFKDSASKLYNQQLEIINSYSDKGKPIPDAMMKNLDIYDSQKEGMTLGHASKLSEKASIKVADALHPGTYTSKDIDRLWQGFNTITGTTTTFEDFKRLINDETAVSMGMEKLNTVMEDMSLKAEQAGMPKEVVKSLLELSTIYLLPKATGLAKGVADYTGSTNLIKRLAFKSDKRRLDGQIEKARKVVDNDNATGGRYLKNNIERTANRDTLKFLIEEQTRNQYHSVTHSSVYKLPSEVDPTAIKQANESRNKAEKILSNVKDQDSFTAVAETLIRSQKSINKNMIYEQMQYVDGLIAIEAKGKNLNNVDTNILREEINRELELKETEPKYTIKSKTAQKIWVDVLAPLRKDSLLLAKKLENSNRKVNENIFKVDPKGFQAKKNKQTELTPGQRIQAAITGSRAFEAIYGPAELRVVKNALEESQVYYAVERVHSPILTQYVDNFFNKAEIAFDKNSMKYPVQYKEGPATIVYPKGTIDFTKPLFDNKGQRLRDTSKREIRDNYISDINNMARDMEIAGMFESGMGHKVNFIKMAQGYHVKKSGWTQAQHLESLKYYNELHNKFNKKDYLDPKERNRDAKALKTLERSIAYKKKMVEFYDLNPRKFRNILENLKEKIENNQTRSLINIKKVKGNENLSGNQALYEINEFVKSSEGKLVSIPNKKLTKQFNQHMTRLAELGIKEGLPELSNFKFNKKGKTLEWSGKGNDGLINATIRNATRLEVETVYPSTIVGNPVYVAGMKWIDAQQLARDNVFIENFTKNPFLKNKIAPEGSLDNVFKDTSKPELLRKASGKLDTYRGQKDLEGIQVKETSGPKERLTETDAAGLGLPEIENYRYTPRVKEILEDLLVQRKPGIIQHISNTMIRNMLLNPLPHIHNEVIHLLGTAGITVFSPKNSIAMFGPGGHLAKGWEDVTQNTKLFKTVQESGSTMSSSIVSSRYFDAFTQSIAKKYLIPPKGSVIKKYATAVGLKPAELYGKVADRMSRQGMWQARDAMYMGLIRWKMSKNKGMTLDNAIKLVDSHMPTYKLPTRVGEKILGAKLSRFLSRRILQDPRITIFGRYKHGMISSGLNTIRDISVILDTPLRTKGGKAGETLAEFFDAREIAYGRDIKQQFQDGVASALALSATSMILYTMIDALMQDAVGGNNQLHMRKGGILHLLQTFNEVFSGKKDNYALYANLHTLNPVLNTGVELAANVTLYNKQPIYDVNSSTGTIFGDISEKLLSTIPINSQLSSMNSTGKFDWKKLGLNQIDVKTKTFKQVQAMKLNQQRQKTKRRNEEIKKITEDYNRAINQ